MTLLELGPWLRIRTHHITRHELVNIQKLLSQRSVIFVILPHDILLFACLITTALSAL